MSFFSAPQHPPKPGNRVTLSYGISHLSAHEALLLKSLVRLLGHRTLHGWVFQAEGAALQVVGQDGAPPIGAVPTAAPLQLYVSNTDSPHPLSLRLPLHVGALESMLNQVGEQLAQKQTRASLALTSFGNETYQLKRWPPAALLGSPDRMKLATLLTARALCLAGLAQRSQQPIGECEHFLHALQHAGLLTEHSAATSPAAPAQAPAPAGGLLARIRHRLGLASTAIP